jgi:hypothetical protein
MPQRAPAGKPLQPGAVVASLARMAAMVLVVALLGLFFATLLLATATVVRDLTAQAQGRTLHPQHNAADHPLEGGPSGAA